MWSKILRALNPFDATIDNLLLAEGCSTCRHNFVLKHQHMCEHCQVKVKCVIGDDITIGYRNWKPMRWWQQN